MVYCAVETAHIFIAIGSLNYPHSQTLNTVFLSNFLMKKKLCLQLQAHRVREFKVMGNISSVVQQWCFWLPDKQEQNLKALWQSPGWHFNNYNPLWSQKDSEATLSAWYMCGAISGVPYINFGLLINQTVAVSKGGYFKMNPFRLHLPSVQLPSTFRSSPHSSRSLPGFCTPMRKMHDYDLTGGEWQGRGLMRKE